MGPQGTREELLLGLRARVHWLERSGYPLSAFHDSPAFIPDKSPDVITLQEEGGIWEAKKLMSDDLLDEKALNNKPFQKIPSLYNSLGKAYFPYSPKGCTIDLFG